MTTFHIGTGLYLIVIAMLSSTVGGYLAGRLRTRWTGVHTDEVYFRDTAHGFIAWAAAIVVSAAALGTAGSAIVGGAAASLSRVEGGPAAIYVDELFRPAPGASTASTATPASSTATAPAAATAPGASAAGAAPVAVTPAERAEVSRLLLRSFRDRNDVAGSDRSYLVQVVSTHTGLSQADADKRVNDVLTEAKSDLDKARSAAAKLSLWLTAALFAGAFCASLGAIEGGQLRDRKFM
jgi:hypothetical protein